MKTGKIIAELRDNKGWSQTNLANHSGVSRVMVGKYEREEAIPSIDAAKKIADAFQVSLDYLVGDGQHSSFDKKTVKRLEDITGFSKEDQEHIFYTIDALINNIKLKALAQG